MMLNDNEDGEGRTAPVMLESSHVTTSSAIAPDYCSRLFLEEFEDLNNNNKLNSKLTYTQEIS